VYPATQLEHLRSCNRQTAYLAPSSEHVLKMPPDSRTMGHWLGMVCKWVIPHHV